MIGHFSATGRARRHPSAPDRSARAPRRGRRERARGTTPRASRPGAQAHMLERVNGDDLARPGVGERQFPGRGYPLQVVRARDRCPRAEARAGRAGRRRSRAGCYRWRRIVQPENRCAYFGSNPDHLAARAVEVVAAPHRDGRALEAAKANRPSGIRGDGPAEGAVARRRGGRTRCGSLGSRETSQAGHQGRLTGAREDARQRAASANSPGTARSSRTAPAKTAVTMTARTPSGRPGMRPTATATPAAPASRRLVPTENQGPRSQPSLRAT